MESLFEIYNKKEDKKLIYLRKYILAFFVNELKRPIEDLSSIHKFISFKDVNKIKNKNNSVFNKLLKSQNLI